MEAWGLVLTAAGIPYRLESNEVGWTILVSAADVDKAREALDAYDEEARGAPSPTVPEAAPADTAWIIGIALGAALLGFFAVTGPPTAGSRWFEPGAGAVGPMLHGEPWRAVTALTLHVDTIHVVSNAIATALLVSPIVQRFGVGGGVWLVLLAGTTGNLISAALQSIDHVAVGASTATFGAIGILTALQLSAKGGTTGRRWIVPVAALLLLVMLGTSRTADVLAHAVGLLTGGALGFVASVSRQRLPAPIQWALVAAAALTVVGCWHLALSRGAG